MNTFFKNLICFVSFIRAGYEGWSDSTCCYNNSTSVVTPGFVCQPEHSHGVENLNLSQPLEIKSAKENLQEDLYREDHLLDYNNPLTDTSTYFTFPLIRDNYPQGHLESNIGQSGFHSKDYNLTSSVFSTSSSNPQSYFHGQPLFYSNAQNSTQILQNQFGHSSWTERYKYIKERHNPDLTMNSRIYRTNFTCFLTKELFLSKSKEILTYQIKKHGNCDKLEYVDHILELIVSNFETDYKSASLFVIYIAFATHGFKKYVSEHKSYRIQHLLSISAVNSIFSDISLKNTINIWKGYKLKFYNIKTGYEILVYIGFRFSFVDNHKNADNFVFSYKRYVKYCLEEFYLANNVLHGIVNS